MNNQIENKYGFVAPVITETERIFGASPTPSEDLQPDGQWGAFLPFDEMQNRNGLETYNCTAFGTNNAIEIYVARKFNQKKDYSDRFTGIMAGTLPPGNSPHIVADSIRKNGAIDESVLSFHDSVESLDEYFSFGSSVSSDECKKLGKEWLESYDFQHDWVFTSEVSLPEKITRMVAALRHSPLGVSVHAWKKGGDGLFFKTSEDRDNHWVCLYGYVYGKYWEIFDSYDNTHKKLKWDYAFEFAKRYYIDTKKKEPVEVEAPVAEKPKVASWWEKLKKWFDALNDLLEQIFNKNKYEWGNA